jgi:hypothetical protein
MMANEKARPMSEQNDATLMNRKKLTTISLVHFLTPMFFLACILNHLLASSAALRIVKVVAIAGRVAEPDSHMTVGTLFL